MLAPKQCDLTRFAKAQDPVYSGVMAELAAGRKRTHWMWFIFPQVAGLGLSSMSRFYAIHDLGEARAYLADPVLGARLHECASAVLAVQDRPVAAIFGAPDDMKLKSSMTLFAHASDLSDSVFTKVLEKYFGGEEDIETLVRLETTPDDRQS